MHLADVVALCRKQASAAIYADSCMHKVHQLAKSYLEEPGARSGTQLVLSACAACDAGELRWQHFARRRGEKGAERVQAFWLLPAPASSWQECGSVAEALKAVCVAVDMPTCRELHDCTEVGTYFLKKYV